VRETFLWTGSISHTALFGACPMKVIYLTQGQFALVDDEDYEWLNQWKWYAAWYPCTKSYYAQRAESKPGGGECTVRMHRLILGLRHGDKREVDHIHHDTLDNRRSQLRIVTHQQNAFNLRDVKGYILRKTSGKFQAQIRLNGKYRHLGSYDTAKQASTAYLEAKKKRDVFLEDKSVVRRPRLILLKNQNINRARKGHKPIY